MKAYILLLTASLWLGHPVLNAHNSPLQQIKKERKLSNEEIKQRGIDVRVKKVIKYLNNGDSRSYARSPIYETPKGYKWKIINVKTGKFIAVEVDKNFKIIRKSK